MRHFIFRACATLLASASTTLHGQEPTGRSDAATLVGELGCAACHAELAAPTTLRERAPDLGSAGLRYNPAYLFDYLQNPQTVRRHLGRARMPDFHLGADEALALSLFLAEQKHVPGSWPELPPEVRNLPAVGETLSTQQFEDLTTREMGCNACHPLDGDGGVLAVDHHDIGHRLQPDWVKEYLVAPARFGVAAAAMPAQFYELKPDRSGFRAIVPEAAAKIARITDYLFSRKKAERAEFQSRFDAAKAASPKVDAALGESVFRALNCAACHRHPTIAPRKTDAAPDLTREGQRVSDEWLRGYLARPHAIRPFGNRPGDGGRMPDFRLSPEEAKTIAGFVTAQAGAKAVVTFEPAKLSAFAMRKARLLFHDKLPCLGCHQLGATGGRIGPDLTGVGERLRPEYVYRMIVDPQGTVPRTVMPRFPMPEATARLIANFLLQSGGKATEAKRTYLSLVENRVLPISGIRDATPAHLYLTRCAACHGAAGRADGFNARFLAVKPTVHADSNYMSKRPDDTLFDGIHAGGYILNKSHLMPAWGQSLSTRQIRGLVEHMRILCRCQGPSWSRDK